MGAVYIIHERAEPGDLPALCIRCGETATTTRTTTFSRPPGWTSALAFLGGAPSLLASWLFRDRVRLPVPLCARHRHHFLWQSGLFWGGLLGLIGAFAGLVTHSSGSHSGLLADCLPGLAVLGAGGLLVVLVQFFRSTSACLIDDKGVLLGGVANRFAQAYEANRRATPTNRDGAVAPWRDTPSGRRALRGPTVSVGNDHTAYWDAPSCEGLTRS